MIFSELYSAYYNTVARVLKTALSRPVTAGELREIIGKNAFGESVLNIEPAIAEGRWQLITPDGGTMIENEPTMPLTTLEKRWLKSVYADPRVRLFTDETPDLKGVEPLFTEKDYSVFDRYSDGDPYTDEGYIRVFRTVLDAVRNKTPLDIETTNRRGRTARLTVMPDRIEYSEKDDKFRLIGYGRRKADTVNLARIVRCGPSKKSQEFFERTAAQAQELTVEFELYDSRNALERVLLHFAHFEKRAERLDDNKYKISVTYDKDDETELVIRILSFGPMVKVTSPKRFVDLIKDRLISQKSCEL